MTTSALCQQGRSKVVIPDRYLVVENVPRGFKEFQFIWIGDLTGAGIMQVTGNAYVNEEWAEMNGTIQGRNFSFTVSGHEQTTYRFTGRFLKESAPKGLRPVLEGTLTKLKRGQRLVSARIRFVIGEGMNT